MSDLALEARGLVRRYGDVVAVDHVDLVVPRGGLTALLGPSGCGKSTALRLIAGLDSGEGVIDIDGERVTGGRRDVPPEARGVGLVFQDSVLFPHLSVRANVEYGLRGSDRGARAMRMLEMLDIPHLAGRFPSEISGGEQQRTALARTLATGPRLVLLDEPFAHLDASLRERVRDETLLALERTGTSALLVTHDQSEALAVADHLVVMNRGRVHQAGAPREVYARPADRFTAEFVGRATLVPARVASAGVAETPIGRVEVDRATPPGPRLAVLRPEALAIVDDGRGVPGRIEATSFRGADELRRVRLRGGTIIEVGDDSDRRVGDDVALAVVRPVATVPDVAAQTASS